MALARPRPRLRARDRFCRRTKFNVTTITVCYGIVLQFIKYNTLIVMYRINSSYNYSIYMQE